ncbi:MAG: 30S ribosomal protein S20 [bacterium]
MAEHLSVKKRTRQDKIRALRNRSRRSNLRTTIKKVLTSVADNNVSQAQATLQEAISAIDRAVAKNIIHKNNAARKKSQLMRKINALAPSKS